MAMKPIDEELNYSHFSHRHPLEYTKLFPNEFTSCFGCKLKILPGNYYYKCKTCSFFLHQVCFNMPKNVNHPCDPNHSLTLQSIPSLSSKVSIKCKACGNQIKGFYYSCSKCIDYYHTLCLAAPLSIKAPSHHHLLNIEFSPLYDFECDLCNKPSYSGWLYHCNVCEFDAHLSCVLAQILRQNHLTTSEAKLSNADSDKRNELLELLTRGAWNVGEIKDHHSFLSEDPTMPSFQFSDACFSIDFEKSLLGGDVGKDVASRGAKMGILEENEGDNQGRSSHSNNSNQSKEESKRSKSYNRALSDGMNTKVSKGIGSNIWSEMEHDSLKRLANGSVTGKSDKVVISGCSSLPKLFVCFSQVRWNREPKASNGGKNFR